MAKTWVLDTETKGTGANMVPLEEALRKRASDPVPGFGFRKPEPPPPAEPEPAGPLEFKVVDIMTREVLAEGADVRATVTALEAVGGIVDIKVYVWEPAAERWRMLTFGETKALWEYRGNLPPSQESNTPSPDRA
jgi:hypothetical protein